MTNIYLLETKDKVFVVMNRGNIFDIEIATNPIEAIKLVKDYLFQNGIFQFITFTTNLEILDNYKDKGLNLRFGSLDDQQHD